MKITTKDKMKHFDRTINRSIRLIYRLNRNDLSTSITELRQQLNWMMTTDSIDYKLLAIQRKLLHKNNNMYYYHLTLNPTDI